MLVTGIFYTAVLYLFGCYQNYSCDHEYTLRGFLNTNRLRSWKKLPLVDDVLKYIFLYDFCLIFITIALHFVPSDPIDNGAALVHIMAWCQNGDKPLSEPMTTQLYWRIYMPFGLAELTHLDRVAHICVSKLTIIGSDNGLSPGRR